MFYKKKEITVALSSEGIAERLWGIKKKSPLFQKITLDRFRVRINSNRRSLYKTSISGIVSGEIISTENAGINKIIYRTEPPIFFWAYSLLFLFFLLTLFVRFFSAYAKGIQLNIGLNLISLFMIFLFEFLTFAESLSQTNISEERFLKAFEKETLRKSDY